MSFLCSNIIQVHMLVCNPHYVPNNNRLDAPMRVQNRRNRKAREQREAGQTELFET